MDFDVKHFVLSHLVWVGVVIVGVIGIHSYMAEHDQRLLAEQQIKVSEQVVKGLQDQIVTTKEQIQTLQQSMKDVSAAAAKQVQVIVKQQEQVKTPQQAIDSIASVSTRVLDPRTIVDAPERASVLAMPLFSELSECSIGRITLNACTQNLATETKVAEANDSNYQKQIAITTEKQKEIDALKKPRGFWANVKSSAKWIGFGIGLGYTLGRR